MISSGAVRLTATTLLQRSSAMLASFLSRVMPALCTTTSTPPWCSRRWWAMRCGASLAVMSRTRWSPSSSAIRVCSSLAACGTSTPTTVAPSRCSTRAISSPMPRLAPVTSATFPASGRVQSSTWSVRGGAVGADADDLPGDVRRLRRQQEGERGADRAVGGRRDVDELDGPAAADLLAERAGEALQRALRDALGARRQLRRRTDHDHARAPLEPAHQGGEELLEREQPGGVGDAGGVEDECLGARTVGEVGRGGDAEAVEGGGEHLGQAPLPSQHDEPVDEGGAVAPALQRGRVGQAEVLDEQLADRGGHEALVAVAHGGGIPLRWVRVLGWADDM